MKKTSTSNPAKKPAQASLRKPASKAKPATRAEQHSLFFAVKPVQDTGGFISQVNGYGKPTYSQVGCHAGV